MVRWPQIPKQGHGCGDEEGEPGSSGPRAGSATEIRNRCPVCLETFLSQFGNQVGDRFHNGTCGPDEESLNGSEAVKSWRQHKGLHPSDLRHEKLAVFTGAC
ncbi:hypothetical protein DPEC_G00263910 [Dallia pectoralis]|uniref:Uncharacterized protein n=1 Tax=Dallia pectoralis TaxID=75939 RepID=A0ACC2FSH4_DALPE|nr:hypothetical protein DPEC_G00263910 [Dallia pectoralis]